MNLPQTKIITALLITIVVLSSCTSSPQKTKEDGSVVGYYKAELTDAPLRINLKWPSLKKQRMIAIKVAYTAHLAACSKY